MLRLIPRKLLLQVGLTALWVPSLASAQIFARAEFDVETPVNTSCGLTSCPPRALTYGYYHEHWRRWPEEPTTTVSAEALSPFAKPDRRVPTVDLPEPRMEDSMAPRRPPAGSGAGAQTRTTRPSTATPPAPQTTPSLPEISIPQENQNEPEPPPSGFGLPFDQPEQPADQNGFLPPAEGADTGEFPETFPDQPLNDTLPPFDLKNDALPAPETPDDNTDDVFNLDDFGRVNPQRLQRYRLSSTRQLRRAGVIRTHSATRPPASGQGRVQLAAYRRPSDGRHNPLREDREPIERESQTVAVPGIETAASWSTEPIADSPRPPQTQSAPLEWNQPTETPQRASGRPNPLR